MPRNAPPITPPSAARKAPKAKMSMEMREVSMPTPRAIWASSTVARTAAPMRVFSIASHRAIADRQRHGDHEHPVERQVEAADHDALGQAAGGVMSKLLPVQMSSAAC